MVIQKEEAFYPMKEVERSTVSNQSKQCLGLTIIIATQNSQYIPNA